MNFRYLTYLVFCLSILCQSCEEESIGNSTPIDQVPPSEPGVFTIPVVVHILHYGVPIGEGSNLAEAKILRQIEILNEDFGRFENTRGFNTNPISEDSKIRFVLAKQDPDGLKTNGITRTQIDFNELPADIPNTEFDRLGHFISWNSSEYINIWVAPYAEETANVHLGAATGPDSDLPGDHLFQKPLPNGKEGIVINQWNFGESQLTGGHNLGRTLTHEMGHYLGLLHPWGGKDCESNDYCADTPAVDEPVNKSTPYPGCTGETVMIENYMNWTPDRIINTFTQDQIARMHYILDNSPRRQSLLTSPGLREP